PSPGSIVSSMHAPGMGLPRAQHRQATGERSMRVAGVNLLAVLAGAIGFYMVGFVFYGGLFTNVWGNETLKNHGLPAHAPPTLSNEAMMAAMQQIPGAMSAGMAYGLGFLLTLLTAFGIGFVVTKTNATTLPAALGRAFVLWLCFGAM